ncbi:MAG: acyl-CoA dehydrogenase family protein [Gammaproteobacteria bacterium]
MPLNARIRSMQFNETQRMIREHAARFARDKLLPNAAPLDRGEGEKEYLQNLRELAAMGFNGIAVDNTYGGAQAGAVAYALAVFELAKACASTTVAVSVTNMAAEVVQAVGNEAQKNKYLPPLMRGDFAAASFCLSESGAGSDPAAMRTRAEKDGEGFVLHGAKQWISSAKIAGFFLVWAVTDKQAARGRGISCFIVESNSEGVSIGPDVDKMGQRGSPTNEVVFDGVRVGAESLLGELNGGYAIAMRELFGGRIGVAAMALGIADAALSTARDYMLVREQHGKKLAGHQGLRWMFAERRAETEAAFWLMIRAATLKDDGEDFITEAAMAKYLAAQAGERACRDALQLHGGYGYMRDLPLERYCRDIRIAAIYEGSDEMQKNIIARQLLKQGEQGETKQ